MYTALARLGGWDTTPVEETGPTETRGPTGATGPTGAIGPTGPTETRNLSSLEVDDRAFTGNNALSLGTTKSTLVDFFTQMTRDTSSRVREDLLQGAWNENPLLTLKLIFHLFDCRGGKKERNQGERCLLWLMDLHCEDLMVNFEHIWFYGYWKSYLIFLGTPIEREMIAFYTDGTRRDLLRVTEGKISEITLNAKFLPREGCFHDKKFHAAWKFASALRVNKRDYRKDIIGVLAPHVKVVETLMCSGKWTDIEYPKVPSIAGKRYEKAFRRHDSEGYNGFVEDVKSGRTNTSQNMAYEFTGYYLKNWNGGSEFGCLIDEDVEVRWSEYLKQTIGSLRRSYSRKDQQRMWNMMVVADVSSSMYRANDGVRVRPIDVSVALAILGSQLLPETSPFYKQWISFSETPELHEIEATTLRDQIKDAVNAVWGMKINLQAMFDLVLDMATSLKVTQENIPELFVIVSYIEFDEATRKNDRANVEVYRQKFVEAGYTPPDVIFWNVNSTNVQFPASHDAGGVALVSGFSPELFSSLLQSGDMTPYRMMIRALFDPRYDRVILSSETQGKLTSIWHRSEVISFK